MKILTTMLSRRTVFALFILCSALSALSSPQTTPNCNCNEVGSRFEAIKAAQEDLINTRIRRSLNGEKVLLDIDLSLNDFALHCKNMMEQLSVIFVITAVDVDNNLISKRAVQFACTRTIIRNSVGLDPSFEEERVALREQSDETAAAVQGLRQQLAALVEGERIVMDEPQFFIPGADILAHSFSLPGFDRSQLGKLALMIAVSHRTCPTKIVGFSKVIYSKPQNSSQTDKLQGGQSNGSPETKESKMSSRGERQQTQTVEKALGTLSFTQVQASGQSTQDLQMRLYPSISRDIVTLAGPFDNLPITIFNSTGKPVLEVIPTKETISHTININNWPTGLYFVKSQDGAVRRLVKQ